MNFPVAAATYLNKRGAWKLNSQELVRIELQPLLSIAYFTAYKRVAPSAGKQVYRSPCEVFAFEHKSCRQRAFQVISLLSLIR